MKGAAVAIYTKYNQDKENKDVTSRVSFALLKALTFPLSCLPCPFQYIDHFPD